MRMSCGATQTRGPAFSACETCVSRMLLQSRLTFTQIPEIAADLWLACDLVHSQMSNRSNSLHTHVPGVFGL